jgi:hypothetical protein
MGRTRAYTHIAMAVMAIAWCISPPAYAQEFQAFGGGPAAMPNPSIDFNTFLQGAWLSNLGLGKASVGIFAGGGTLRVSHTIEAGPNFVAAIPGFHDFDDFSHVR